MENEGTSLSFLKMFYDIREKDLILGIVYFLRASTIRKINHLPKVSFQTPHIFFQHFFLFFSFSFPFFLIFETERESTSCGRIEREGDTESEVGSRLRAVSTESNEGLEPTNRKIMT